MAGGRSVARATSVPTVIRPVAAATDAVMVSSSRAGRRSPPSASPRRRNRWSKAKTPSSPASSAASATASTRSGSDWNDGSVSPTRTAARLPVPVMRHPAHPAFLCNDRCCGGTPKCPAAWALRSRGRDEGAGQGGGADGAGLLAESGGHHRRHRPQRGRLHMGG